MTRRRARNERGAALVEFALVLPLFMLLISGIIDFGNAYSDLQAVRLGVRDGGRRAAVATTGGSTGCGLTFAAGAPNTPTQQLMCLVKGSVGLSSSRVRVKILFADPNTGATGASHYVRGETVIVCTMAKARSVTGMLGNMISGIGLRSKSQFRIEQVASPVLQESEELAITGSWSWCTSGAAP
jgi:TadE-like protein